MGYERKSLQILGGSFTMLPPVDKVPKTDYLLAQNWRSDALGRLVSRAGYGAKFALAGAGIAHSAANTGGVSSPYYVGCNSGITSPTSKLYYLGATIPAIALATGFDGNRIAFASQNNFMWVMNRGRQGRHGGSAAGAFETWTLAPPPASATVAAGSSPAPAVSATYTYISQGDPTYNHFLTICGVTYSFPENGYSNDQIPLVMSLLAAADPNCSVTFAGTGNNLVITPIIPFTLMPVSGSDGNAAANLASGAVSSLPNGTYQFYLTFESADESLESNPGPVSLPVTVTSQAIVVTIPAADAPTDSRVGFVNIYATGGTLGQPYRVGRVPSTVASPATTFTDTIPDLDATNNGVVMPTDHDGPPAASGMIGPHYSRLFAWSTAANVNRLFYTDANLPQYWPGSADSQIGNWVDVGLDGEAIVWCSIHGNLTIIYKERSIWMLIGDPSNGTLQQVHEGVGLAGQFGLAPAGLIDYFVGPNGLYLFDMDKVHDISGAVLPLFNQSSTNAGALTVPGSVLPGTAFNSTSMFPYALALGHALGKLYIGYAEQGGSYNLLVFNEGPEPERQAFIEPRTGKWFYQRHAIPSTLGFFGFFFDGVAMCGLTGAVGGTAQGLSIDDFRGFLTADTGGAAIECVYQSHYDDCGLPDNDKMWLEATIDYEFQGGATANVYVGFNNGKIPLELIGTLSAAVRTTVSFGFPGSVDAGVLARNISIAVDAMATGRAVIHNVYLYYYAEARLALVASTLPTDLGVGKVKECKELELDINPYGPVSIALQSDLPGNALATRETIAAENAGRAILKFPFATITGYLWQVSLVGGPFRLYSARLLMRVLGVCVEGRESSAGFRWDSMQFPLGDGEASSVWQLRFEMDADGPSSVELFTDLPGEASASRGVFVLTTGFTARAWVNVPLPGGIEARSVRVQVTGNTGYRIYRAQVRHGRIGRYLAGTAPDAAQDTFNTLEFDFSTERVKLFKRIEMDLRAEGIVNLNVITNQDGDRIATIYSPAVTTPNGRATVLIPLVPGVRGRLLRLQLTSATAARIYRLRVLTRPVSETGAEWKWEEFPLEASDVLPVWADFIVEETPPVWQWVDIPFEVTGE